jgi:hypothetical protein
VRQLVDEEIFFGVGQFQTGERRDAIDIGAGQPLGHAKCYHAGI